MNIRIAFFIICALILLSSPEAYAQPITAPALRPVECIRADTLGTIAQAEGERAPCLMDSNGQIYVITPTPAYQKTVGDTAGTDPLVVTACRRDDVTSPQQTDGKYITLVCDDHGRLIVTLGTKLDPVNDGVRMHGTDDGGTTQRQVKTNSAGEVFIAGGALEATLQSILTALQILDDAETGASVHYRTSAGATEDEHEIKATAGRLFSVTFTNTNAAVRYWRCYNLTAANTTPGTSTVFIGGAIPGATTGAGITTNFGRSGIAFSTALTCAWTTGAADTDVAEVAANEIKGIYVYK